jgi:hypothetical protein
MFGAQSHRDVCAERSEVWKIGSNVSNDYSSVVTLRASKLITDKAWMVCSLALGSRGATLVIVAHTGAQESGYT